MRENRTPRDDPLSLVVIVSRHHEGRLNVGFSLLVRQAVDTTSNDEDNHQDDGGPQQDLSSWLLALALIWPHFAIQAFGANCLESGKVAAFAALKFILTLDTSAIFQEQSILT